MTDGLKLRGKYIYEAAPSVPGSDALPSIGPTYRNVKAKDGFTRPAVNTLYEAFQSSVEKYGDNDCLGRRLNGEGPFIFESYKVRAHVKIREKHPLPSLRNTRRQTRCRMFARH